MMIPLCSQHSEFSLFIERLPYDICTDGQFWSEDIFQDEPVSLKRGFSAFAKGRELGDTLQSTQAERSCYWSTFCLSKDKFDFCYSSLLDKIGIYGNLFMLRVFSLGECNTILSAYTLYRHLE